MVAPKGNQFWKAAEQYFNWVEANPIQTSFYRVSELLNNGNITVTLKELREHHQEHKQQQDHNKIDRAKEY